MARLQLGILPLHPSMHIITRGSRLQLPSSVAYLPSNRTCHHGLVWGLVLLPLRWNMRLYLTSPHPAARGSRRHGARSTAQAPPTPLHTRSYSTETTRGLLQTQDLGPPPGISLRMAQRHSPPHATGKLATRTNPNPSLRSLPNPHPVGRSKSPHTTARLHSSIKDTYNHPAVRHGQHQCRTRGGRGAPFQALLGGLPQL